MDTYEDRIEELATAIDMWMHNYTEDPPDGLKEEEESCQEGLLEPLSSLTAILREAENIAYPQFDNLVAQTDNIINKILDWAHGGPDDDGSGPYSYEKCMPSFAHDNEAAPLLKDPRNTKTTHGFVGMMLPHLDSFAEFFLNGDVEAVKAKLMGNMKAAVPWRKTLRPHPLSTPCSRFMDDIPEWTVTDRNHHATSVVQARCEVESCDINTPCDMRLSSIGNILALSSMAGWKNRIPYIHYHLPSEDTGEPLKIYAIKVDLMSGLKEILVDDDRRLVFASDWDRIRSYRCKEPNVPKNHPGARSLRVHAMASKGYDGPLAMLPNGRLAKAGKGKVAIWDLDSLQTHGATGQDFVGDAYTEEIETWREDAEDIERSKGSNATTTIVLPSITGNDDNSAYEIHKWHRHPSQDNILLCAGDPKSQNYFCHALDFEAGGKAVARYLGHGDRIDDFSTSAADPNMFLTSCADGHARLYDVRHPLPVMTFAAAKKPEAMPAAVLAHPDGVPFVFTGAGESQHIKLWDVRARAFIYELATGNNQVESMAWDANSNSLYAATSCPNISYNGRHTNYRVARIPKVRVDEDESDQAVQTDNAEDADEWSDEEDGSDISEDDLEDEDESFCWPQRAHHAENHFGHVFDAGDHRLYKFSFKMNPDPDVLPYYGSASINEGGDWGV